MIFLKQLGFLAIMTLLGGASFYATASLLAKGANQHQDQSTKRSPAAESVAARQSLAAETYCEVSFPVDNCPAYPGAYPISRANVLRDSWDGAEASLERCLKRAQEFHNFCKFEGNVTARFYRDGKVAGSRNFP